jgi:hypothetical protein
MTASLKLKRRHMDNMVRLALAAQDSYIKARRAAGLKGRRAIYTAEEMMAARQEWYQQFAGMMCAQNDPTYRRAEELAVGLAYSIEAAASAKKLAKQITSAAATARAGGPELPKPTGLAAEILRSGEKRRKLSS